MTENERRRLKICHAGCILLRIFVALLFLFVGIFIAGGLIGAFPNVNSIMIDTSFWLLYILFAVVVETLLFWLGIIMVYFTSEQLGFRWRVLGILCELIPIVNIIMLYIIVSTAAKECRVERERIKRDKARVAEKICNTRYPILMVHGVFFRDFKRVNYWGRVPKELELNGAKIFYGNHSSAAPVRECGKELKDRIEQIIKETGADKVNVIAHSKGGLDTRAALNIPGVAEHVATLTTINTPHRGCEFADYLLGKVPDSVRDSVARTYNAAASKLGDPNPDFIAAVTDLTHEKCMSFNEEMKDAPGVYYQSFGSKINSAISGRFPLAFTTDFVAKFDGPNDGLVGVESFSWGQKYQFVDVKGGRGVSHGDMIDLYRENLDNFDVREFYVQIVADLKNKGY